MIAVKLKTCLPPFVHSNIPLISMYAEDRLFMQKYGLSNIFSAMNLMDHHIDQYAFSTPSLRFLSTETLHRICIAYEVIHGGSAINRRTLVRHVRELIEGECNGDDYRGHQYPIRALAAGLLIAKNWKLLCPGDLETLLAAYQVQTISEALAYQNLLIELADTRGGDAYECRGIETMRAFYDPRNRSRKFSKESHPTVVQKSLLNCCVEDPDGDTDWQATFAKWIRKLKQNKVSSLKNKKWH